MTKKTISLIGTLGISFDEQAKAFIQFVPDDPDSVEIDSILLEGTAQLLRSGQFDFVANHINKLIVSYE